MAEEAGVPLLLVPDDTYRVARQIDGIRPQLQPGDQSAVELDGATVGEAIDVAALLS